MKTSVSGRTYTPIFNQHSFSLGSVVNEQPEALVMFKAYQVDEESLRRGGKQATTEGLKVGECSVQLGSLSLKQYAKVTSRTLSLVASGS